MSMTIDRKNLRLKELSVSVHFLFHAQENPPLATPEKVEDSPFKDLGKRIYMESLHMVNIPNDGSSRPKPKFREDAENSLVIQRVIRDSRISSVNDLIIILNRSVSEDPLSPISAWKEGNLLDPLTSDFRCFGILLEGAQETWEGPGTNRDRERQDLILAAKRPRYDAEYAEIDPADMVEVVLGGEPESDAHDVKNCIYCNRSPISSIGEPDGE